MLSIFKVLPQFPENARKIHKTHTNLKSRYNWSAKFEVVLYFSTPCRYIMFKLIWYFSIQNNCYIFLNFKLERLTYNSQIEPFSIIIITCNVSVFVLFKWNHCGWVIWCKHRATFIPGVVCCPMHKEALIGPTVCSAIFDMCYARWGGFL